MIPEDDKAVRPTPTDGRGASLSRVSSKQVQSTSSLARRATYHGGRDLPRGERLPSLPDRGALPWLAGSVPSWCRGDPTAGRSASHPFDVSAGQGTVSFLPCSAANPRKGAERSQGCAESVPVCDGPHPAPVRRHSQGGSDTSPGESGLPQGGGGAGPPWGGCHPLPGSVPAPPWYSIAPTRGPRRCSRGRMASQPWGCGSPAVGARRHSPGAEAIPPWRDAASALNFSPPHGWIQVDASREAMESTMADT
jgi:hypothetical protein